MDTDIYLLKRIALAKNDKSLLIELIEEYGRNYSANRQVIQLCRKHILDDPVPDLSGVCIRVLFNCWHLYDEELVAGLGYFFNQDFETYFDELLISCNFLHSKEGRVFLPAFEARCDLFVRWARSEGLLEFEHLMNVGRQASTNEKRDM